MMQTTVKSSCGTTQPAFALDLRFILDPQDHGKGRASLTNASIRIHMVVSPTAFKLTACEVRIEKIGTHVLKSVAARCPVSF